MSEQRIVKYRPHPTTQDFHAEHDFVRGLMGPYGSGKSVACCMEIFSRGQEQEPGPIDLKRKTRWAVIRNSYGELRSTTQKTWTDWFPEEVFGPIRRGSGPDTHLLAFDDVEIEVMFLAMDRDEDVRKLLSLELTGGWINEAREVRWTIMEGLMARVGRYPAKREGGPTWHGIIMDTNPPNTRHWWYQKFELDRPDGWRIFKQPSGLSKEAENIENLPQNYYRNMMAGMDDLSIRAHVHGEYSLLRTGTPVFPQFKHSLHVAAEKIRPIPNAPLFTGIDVGRTPACIVGQVGYGGQVRILAEITASDIPATTLADRIKTLMAKSYVGHEVEHYADPAFTQRSQTRDESVSDVFFNKGLMVMPASTNTIEIRLEAVRTLLQQLDPRGEPMLLIDPECHLLIEAMVGGYSYKDVAIGGDRFVEAPVKNQFSHVADALQYGILGAGYDPRYVAKDHIKPTKVVGLSATGRH
jgi:hypothetical protein